MAESSGLRPTILCGRQSGQRVCLNGGDGGNSHGVMAPASPVAPYAVVRHGIDKFVIRPILGVLLLLLLLHLIRPLPCEVVSNGQFLGKARQAQQRRNVGLADSGGTCKDYDQRTVSMSSMKSLLLPWQMLGWLMTSVLCLIVVVMSIQQRCISHHGQPRTTLSHQRLVHRQCSAAVEAGQRGWREEDGSGGGRSSVEERRQQSQERRRHSILLIGGGVPSCAVVSTTTMMRTTATATTTATMTTTTMWMT